MPRNLSKMFRPTEPVQPIADPIEGSSGSSEKPVPIPGLESLVSSDPVPEKKKLKPQSVYLTKAELAYIQEIAEQYGESRHSVMQFAVKELIREWKKRGQLRTNILGKLDK